MENIQNEENLSLQDLIMEEIELKEKEVKEWLFDLEYGNE